MLVGDTDNLSYVDDIANYVWPVFSDYFYFELRRNQADDANAKAACFPDGGNMPDNAGSVVCGFFKIGRLITIMQRLARSACAEHALDDSCVFGFGNDIPSWAESFAPYQPSARPDAWAYKQVAGPYVWVPAHDPKSDRRSERELGERDQEAFATLYELYQMSLVDTSRIVTGFPPVTISK
jgi:hypothetical protein